MMDDKVNKNRIVRANANILEANSTTIDDQVTSPLVIAPNSACNSFDNISVAEKISNYSVKYKQILQTWKIEQENLSKICNQSLDTYSLDFSNVKFVAGVDISFPKDHSDLIHACACLVIMSYPELDVVYKNCKMVHLTSVYIPEYLAFREIVPYVDMFEELKAERFDIYPHVVLVDGNGLLHPRKFGIASHLGVVLSIPTIGVAKKLFHVDGLEKNKEFKNCVQKLSVKGSAFDLIGNSGFNFGKALKSTLKSTNPIYVSIGYRINIDDALELFLNCCKVRVPEPIRWADVFSREYVKENYAKHTASCNDYSDLNDEFLKLSTCCLR